MAQVAAGWAVGARRVDGGAAPGDGAAPPGDGAAPPGDGEAEGPGVGVWARGGGLEARGPWASAGRAREERDAGGREEQLEGGLAHAALVAGLEPAYAAARALHADDAEGSAAAAAGCSAGSSDACSSDRKLRSTESTEGPPVCGCGESGI